MNKIKRLVLHEGIAMKKCTSGEKFYVDAYTDSLETQFKEN